MRNLFRLVLLSSVLILSIILAVSSSANEPKPETPEDNACYAGGVMEYKCDTNWEWTCGWYLARWITAGGWQGNYVMPIECIILILLYPNAGISFAIEPTFTPTITATITLTTTSTDTPTDTPTNTPTDTPTDTPTNTPTDTPTNTPTDTPTNTPTDTPTNTPTDTPTNTPTNTPTETSTP